MGNRTFNHTPNDRKPAVAAKIETPDGGAIYATVDPNTAFGAAWLAECADRESRANRRKDQELQREKKREERAAYISTIDEILELEGIQ